MSRIGKQPVPVPSGVDIVVAGGAITVKGQHGELSWAFHPAMSVAFDDATQAVVVTRPDDQRQNRALHGLTRSLINNMVAGVVKPFEKRLEIIGVGYNATFNAPNLVLQVGFANSVSLAVPEIVACKLSDNTHIVLTSPDKQAVGQFAAEVRAVRPPEPYKGKGVRYQGEHVRRKAGKAFGAK
ncbi:MAG: 50S ribosomal protein L6 [Planctomycetaceae bacterium]